MILNRKLSLFISLFILVPLLCSCAGVQTRKHRLLVETNRQKVVSAAQEFLGAKKVAARDKVFGYDCSGLVRGIYYKSLGVELTKGVTARPDARGVEVVYAYCKQNGRVHKKKYPFLGDIIFFDRTYDADRDGRVKDTFTHTGIVEKVDEKGTITFIHLDSKGINRGSMNLKHPDTHKDAENNSTMNMFLRKKDNKKPRKRYLAGEVFRIFGTVIR